ERTLQDITFQIEKTFCILARLKVPTFHISDHVVEILWRDEFIDDEIVNRTQYCDECRQENAGDETLHPKHLTVVIVHFFIADREVEHCESDHSEEVGVHQLAVDILVVQPRYFFDGHPRQKGNSVVYRPFEFGLEFFHEQI